MTALSRTHYPTSCFDYELPPGRIARYPEDRRDESRLLVVDRRSDTIRDRVFRELPELIPPGDALVVNETRVFPARLVGRKPTGARAEILLLRQLRGSDAPSPGPAGRTEHGGAQRASAPATFWEALVRPGGKLKPGRVIEIADDLRVEIVDSLPGGTRAVRLVTPLSVDEALRRHGRIPLPPYIEREAESADLERYQTVYARTEGSVAAPTAGLHFTRPLLETLERHGVRTARLVLHVGVGTFRPVETDDPTEHRMHGEYYDVPDEAATILNEVRTRGGAVWAVGTTVARALETVADGSGEIHSGAGWTELFIRPPFRFRGVDHLITNFHLPRSTLLMLVTAFGGYELIMRSYREAIERGYRFYSYGDAMVIV